MNKRSIGLFVFLILATIFCAQSPVADSLQQELNKATDDTVRCNVLNALIEAENNDSIWSGYNERVFIIATKGLQQGGAPPRMSFFRRMIARYYINKAYLEQFVNENSEAAIGLDQKAIDLLKTENDLPNLAIAYNNIGSVYENMGDIKKAVEFYTLSLATKEKTNDREGLALPLNNIGRIFHGQGDFDAAIKYYNRSIDISKALKNKHGIAFASNNLGLSYQKKKDYKKAEEYFKTAIWNWEANKDQRMLSYVYNNLGCLYLEQGMVEPAEEMLEKSYIISSGLRERHVMAYTELNFARIHVYRKDLRGAEKRALSALSLSKEISYPENIRDVALILKDIYLMKKDYGKALTMLELYTSLRDSLLNQENKKASLRSEMKYEYEKKALADSIRIAEEKIVTQAKLEGEKTQRYALYGGLGLVGIFAAFMVQRFRITNRQRKLIEEQKKTVEQQKAIVEEKQKEILDSIRYARRIQRALLTSEKYIERVLRK